jgi:hypothetical protein
LEPAEHWHAVSIEGAQRAIEIGRLYLQRLQGLRGAPIAIRPVQGSSAAMTSPC